MMSDQHLRNTILLKLRGIIEIRRQTKVMHGVENIDPVNRELYKLNELDPKHAATQIYDVLRRLYPYLAEAYLRGLEGVRETLQEAAGRTTGIADPKEVGLLDEGSEKVDPYTMVYDAGDEPDFG
jgi:hypothetical protein